MAGDIDGDRDIALDDYNAFLAAFSSALGDEHYEPNADYDGDNFIGMTDFGIWYGCYLAFANSWCNAVGELHDRARGAGGQRVQSITSLIESIFLRLAVLLWSYRKKLVWAVRHASNHRGEPAFPA